MRPWLTDAGSLTARILSRCERFSVRVLAQRRLPAMLDEQALFGLRQGETLWVREVLLVADGRPVVYARSVVSDHNLTTAWRLFRGIGSRPLGAALFADPRIQRQPLQSASLGQGDARYHRALSFVDSSDEAPRRLWARRSLFMQRACGLLVTEVFLPGILTLGASRA